MAGVLGQCSGEQLPLPDDIPLDRVSEPWVPDVVRLVGERGQEAARELVLSLRAGLEELEAALYRELYPW